MIDLQTLTKIVAKPVIQESMPLFKKLKDKVTDNISYFFNDGFLDYFSKTLNKYREIKTLLHRQPTNFYDIYYPTKLSYNEEIITTDSVKSLFERNSFITIIGDAGSGKSTLIKHLFITSFIESYKAPIFIALRDLDLAKSNLEVYIRENILQNKLSPSDDFLNKLLNEGEFLFFLDGYDEIKSTDKHEITKNLEKFIDKYPNNNYILTSRPYSNIEYFKNFHNYEIKDLSPEDREAFIKQQIKDERLSNKIVESVKEAEDDYINSFLKNPLLLTLYIITYSKNSSIPSNKYIFYRRVFDVLFAEHDSATKIGFEREIKTALNQETLEKVLQLFSFLSFFDNHFDFEKDYIFSHLNTIKSKYELKFNNNDFIEDMKVSIGLWIEDSGVYSFAHRSMQEYFASVFVTKINDIDNKKRVYEKIVNIVRNRDFDIKNFLSLCYEMDMQFFIKHYSLPIIQKMRELFIDNDSNLNYKIPYISNGFNKQGNVFVTKDLIFLFVIDIIPNKKFEYLFNNISLQFIKNKNHKSFEKFIKIENNCYYLPKYNDITQEYINFIHEIGVDKVLKKAVQELDDMKADFEKEIEKQNLVEDEFINMI